MAEVKNPHEGIEYPNHLSLEWLAEEKLPIYVRNTTRPRGQLAVNFPNSNGRVKVVKIPRIHLPIRLNDQLSYETILGSDDLRACIMKGVVDLIRPDIAWKELQNSDNAQTVSDLQLSQYSSKQTFVSERVNDMEQTVANKVDPASAPMEPMGIDTSTVQPRILKFVEQLRNGDLSIKAAISELKTMESELKDTDCSYIIANGPDGQIKIFVQKILARLQGTAIAEHSVVDDDEGDVPEMTEEEKERERQRESQARSEQQV